MTNVLIVNSSLNSETGNSTKLTQVFEQALMSKSKLNITELNLDEDQLPHLTKEEMGAWMTPVSERTDAQHKLAALSDKYIEQVEASDILVIGMPMYNFGIPSVFKAWIDRIARAGVTFKYTENGPVGLLENKKAFVLAARGGIYKGTAKDTQTQYIKNVMSFIGISDVAFIYAEGLAMGEESFSNAMASANKKIIELTEEIAA